ncbi:MULTISPECIES: hypothetical protein [unclassified Streptomyces]|uniref:hypothetical protein n=1 Tax=unclassified Streptomyces TaxID=2593676 RepID=UPI00288633B2|nr:hypothetical protein [Streptomyces sp. DSM 41633]
MSAESLEQPRTDTPGGDSGGPVDGAPDHSVATIGVSPCRPSSRGRPSLSEQGPDRHPRLRRVAGSKGQDRGGGPGGSGA